MDDKTASHQLKMRNSKLLGRPKYKCVCTWQTFSEYICPCCTSSHFDILHHSGSAQKHSFHDSAKTNVLKYSLIIASDKLLEISILKKISCYDTKLCFSFDRAIVNFFQFGIQPTQFGTLVSALWLANTTGILSLRYFYQQLQQFHKQDNRIYFKI